MRNLIYFSIVIPAHNEERTLIPLLHSLYWQEFDKKLFEVLIVHNNSSDQTTLIAKRCQKMFGEMSIAVLRESSQGVSFARNRGGEWARGKFLIFLDADNIASPYLLSEIYKKTLDHFLAGTIRTLALEKSLKGDTIYWILEIIKQTIPRPFGKNFCSKEIFQKVGGYDTSHDRKVWYLGTNLDFLLRVGHYLSLYKKKNITHIAIPIYTSLRRMEEKGYFRILIRWGMVYIGIPKICKRILEFLSYERE